MHLRLSAREIDENRLLPDLTTHQSSPSIIDASHQSTQKAKTINGSGPSVNSSPTIPEMGATSTMDGSLSFICHHEAHVSLRHVSSCLSTMRSSMGTRDNQVIHAQ
ncbi:hypothetical protein V3481_001437 [Fusarium oxysporum f. sp. vasinfectum]